MPLLLLLLRLLRPPAAIGHTTNAPAVPTTQSTAAPNSNSCASRSDRICVPVPVPVGTLVASWGKGGVRLSWVDLEIGLRLGPTPNNRRRLLLSQPKTSTTSLPIEGIRSIQGHATA